MRWSRHYGIATQLDWENGEVQVNTLFYVTGKEAELIFSTFTFTGDDEYYEAIYA